MNRKVYFNQQAPDSVPFPTLEGSVPAAYVGLTAQQLVDVHGVTVIGELAPANAVTDSAIVGLLDP